MALLLLMLKMLLLIVQIGFGSTNHHRVSQAKGLKHFKGAEYPLV
jgi:hypothetical protein